MTDVTHDRFTAFLEKYPVRTFKKGEIIIFQGEAPRHAFVVKTGVVKGYNLSISGDEKPVAFYTAFETFPGSWVYGKIPSAIYYYEAFTPEVSVYLISREEYVAYIKSEPTLLFEELERYVTDQLGKSM